jgi:hypothetical protein
VVVVVEPMSQLVLVVLVVMAAVVEVDQTQLQDLR